MVVVPLNDYYEDALFLPRRTVHSCGCVCARRVAILLFGKDRISTSEK